jgi:hypothetical protein
MSEILNRGFKDSTASTLEDNIITFAGSTDSSVFDCGAGVVIGILPDSDFAGTTLAPMWSIDGVVFKNVNSVVGTPFSITNIAANVMIALNPADLMSFRYIKFTSNATETATLSIVTRRV